MENYSKDEFMEQVEDSITKIYPKEIVKGEVIYVTDDEVIVNIGYKADGIVSQDELSNEADVKPKDLFEEGQEIEVYVIKLDDGDGNVVLSTRRVEGLKNWEKLVDAYENGDTVKVTLSKEVKGGLLGNVMGIVAFLPGSQVTSNFVKDLGQFVGQELECRILSVDERKRRLVVSSKVILEEEMNKKIDEVWDSFEEGQVVTGKVARLVDFGAFINFGGVVDGLIHISDISWNRIDDPAEVLNVGDEIEVLVLKKNRERNRISLGYKQLQQKPFEAFINNNKIGDVVKGKVVNLTDFGVFVRLDEGVEGLVHISEISHDHIEKPSDELNIDQEIEVKIINTDEERKRIGLSIKALTEPPKKEIKEETAERKPKSKRPKRQKQRQQRQTESYQTGELDTSIGALIDLDLTEEFENFYENDADDDSQLEFDEEIENEVVESEVNEESLEESAISDDQEEASEEV